MSTANDKCYYCGNPTFEPRRVRYIYSREGQSLLVPDFPAEICTHCGMVYYDGAALLQVATQFNAIFHEAQPATRYLTLPVFEFA